MSYHIEQIGDSNFKYIIELPRSKDGRRNRITKSGFPNKSEAKKAAKQKEAEYIRGEFENHGGNMLYSDYLDEWINRISDSGCVKNSTLENYAKVIKNQLKPHLGMYTLKALNYVVLQDFLNKLLKKGYKESTIENHKSVLTASLKYAFRYSYINCNPSDKLDCPKRSSTKEYPSLSNQQKNEYIPEENMHALLSRFPEENPDHLPIILGYRCGLRDGEAYAITWQDVDFNAKMLNIDKQLQYNQKERFWYLTEPKYNSKRRIALDDETIGLLKREKERQEAQKASRKFYVVPLVNKQNIINIEDGKEINFVIRKPNGGFISPNARMHIARVAHYELKIPFTYHSLRHTHATMLAESGFSQLYTHNRLGHKSFAVTAKYYIHVTEKTILKEQDKLEELYSNN